MIKHTLINSFIKKQNDLQDQSKNKPVKTKQSITPQYKLTSKQDFEAMQQNLLESITKVTSADKIDYREILSKFTTGEINIADNQNCSLALNMINTNIKLSKFLNVFVPGQKFLNSYPLKLKLYFTRLYLLEKISFAMPEMNRLLFFSQEISKYVSRGCRATIPCEKLNTVLDNVSEELIDSFSADIKASADPRSIVANVKYAPLQELDIPLSTFMTDITNQFKSAYTIYKNGLNMVIVNLSLIQPEILSEARKVLITKILALIPPNLTLFCDHHYFCHLLRIHLMSPYADEKYPLPLFSPEELNQINGYFTEIHDLLQIMFYLNLKFNLKINVFQHLPVSKMINKMKYLNKIWCL